MKIRERLLQFGFFPENLPPVFDSKHFGAFVDKLPLTANYISSKKATRSGLYNATKRGLQRRHFSIPHPISAVDATLFIEKHWTAIEAHLKKSKFSISTPEEDPSDTRAFKITAHSQIPLIKAKRLAGSRFVVRTDISRFFPSIYTHSLPWSFHGKEQSKLDRETKSTSIYFNRIDYIVRQGQDGQTVGIPVGPDYSRILAEIVSVAIDAEFKKRSKNKSVSMLRHVDDVWIGAETAEEAENLLHTYRAALREFELDINDLKTSIIRTTDDLSESWPRELGDAIKSAFAYNDPFRKADQLSVLEKAFFLTNKSNDDGIIKFVIRKLDEQHAWDTNWEILEPFLLRCVVNYSHSIDYVARILAWRKRTKKELDNKVWSSVINNFINFHSQIGNDSEVCWALWMAYELKLKLQKRYVLDILSNCGSLPIILLLGCRDINLISFSDDQPALVSRFGISPLSGTLWLVAYECKLHGWLAASTWPNETLTDLMQQLLDAEVSFFKATALPPVFEDLEEIEWGTVGQAIEDMSGYDSDDKDDDPEFNLEDLF